MADSSRVERRLGDIADKFLFENGRVRIREMKPTSGDPGSARRHQLDHILIRISGDRIAVLPEADTPECLQQPIFFPGISSFLEKGGIESARNVGKQNFHEILFELRD